MTTPKGLSGTMSKQTHSGNSECLTDEADVLRTPNKTQGIHITRCIRLHLSMYVLLTL